MEILKTGTFWRGMGREERMIRGKADFLVESVGKRLIHYRTPKQPKKCKTRPLLQKGGKFENREIVLFD